MSFVAGIRKSLPTYPVNSAIGSSSSTNSIGALIDSPALASDPQKAAQGQTFWQIDPQNVSGNASDSNSGLAGFPVLHVYEILRRYGTSTPTFPNNVVWEFLSSQGSTGGNGANITTVDDGVATITGLLGLTSANVGQDLTLNVAAAPGNNGSFPITSVSGGGTIATVTNPNAVANDINNSQIQWYLTASNADAIDIQPNSTGGTLLITCVPTVIATGTLSGVVPQNILTEQMLQADIDTLGAVGVFVQNLQPGKESFAWVNAAIGGGLCQLNQPIAPSLFTPGGPPTPPAPLALQAPVGLVDYVTPPLVDTWSDGDAYQLLAYPQINVFRVGSLNNVTPITVFGFVPNEIVRFQRCYIYDVLGTGQSDLNVGKYVAMYECFIQKRVVGFAGEADLLTNRWNCHFAGGVFRDAPGNSDFYGGEIDNMFANESLVTLDGNLTFNAGGLPSEIHRCTFGLVQITSQGLPILGPCNVTYEGDGGDVASNVQKLWGAGAVNLQGSGASLFYQPPASGQGVNGAFSAGPSVGLFEFADTGASFAGGTVTASAPDINGVVTITGVAHDAVTPSMVSQQIVFYDPNNPTNTAGFAILSWVSATSFTISNPAGIASATVTWTPIQQISIINAASPGNNGTFAIYGWISATVLLVANVPSTPGTGAQISQVFTPQQNATISGLSGIPNQYPLFSGANPRNGQNTVTITITGSSVPANNRTYLVYEFLSSTTAQVFVPPDVAVEVDTGSDTYEFAGGVAADANNGHISWSVGSILTTGGLQINGNTAASSYNDTTGAWAANLAITPAQLDTAIGSGGFANGVGGSASAAIQPQTGCSYTSMPTQDTFQF